MIEQYKGSKGYSPTFETKVPESAEELVEILHSYKIDVKSDTERSITMEADGEADTTVKLRSYVKTYEGERKSFFDKIRSVFK